MKREPHLLIASVIVVIGSLILASCGGGSSGSAGDDTIGTAGNGVRTSTLYVNALAPAGAFSGMTTSTPGLVPLAGRSVRLITVDDTGVENSSVASTVVGTDGTVVMTLPVEVELSPRLVVEVAMPTTTSTGDVLRCNVVDENVRVDPVSDYVFRTLVTTVTAPAAKGMGELTPNEILVIRSAIEQFGVDYTALIADRGDMDAHIEAEMGANRATLDELLAQIRLPAPSLDLNVVDGDWSQVVHSLAQVERTTEARGVMGVYGGTATLALNYFDTDAAGRYLAVDTVGADVSHTATLGSTLTYVADQSYVTEADRLVEPAQFMPAGDLFLFEPALDEAEVGIRRQGASYATHYTPLTSWGRGLYVGTATSRVDEYAIAGGVTAAEPHASTVEPQLLVLGRQQSVSAAALGATTFGFVRMETTHLDSTQIPAGARSFTVKVGRMTPLGSAGTTLLSSEAASYHELLRLPDAVNPALATPYFNFGTGTATNERTVAEGTGRLTWSTPRLDADHQGFVVDADVPGAFGASGWVDVVDDVENGEEYRTGADVFVELPTTAPAAVLLDGKTYRLVATFATFGTDGSSVYGRSAPDVTCVFSGATATIAGHIVEARRLTDVDAVDDVSRYHAATAYDVTVEPGGVAGHLVLGAAGTGEEWRGWASRDLSVLVMRYKRDTATARGVGMGVFVQR